LATAAWVGIRET